jgi:hypothetical protein
MHARPRGTARPRPGHLRDEEIRQVVAAFAIIGMEQRLSQPAMGGLLKCFEEYHKADGW